MPDSEGLKSLLVDLVAGSQLQADVSHSVAFWDARIDFQQVEDGSSCVNHVGSVPNTV